MSITIVLDPGHGGADPGVVRGNEWERLTEKDWVLELGFILANQIGHLPGLQAALTREDDRNLGLDEVARLAVEIGADLAICLHVNAYDDPHEHGLIPFHMPGDSTSRLVAEAIALHAPQFLRGRFTRPEPATVTRWPRVNACLQPFVARHVPAVLVECGYATNTPDRQYLLSAPGKHAVATAITAGVIEFWRADATVKECAP